MSQSINNDLVIGLPDCIKLFKDETTLIVRISREAKRNSLSDELVLGLSALFAAIPVDITGVVLHGEGEHFCAGLDLNEVKEGTLQKGLQTSAIGQRLNDLLQYSRVPVIAVLHGAVIGGGLELACAAHIRVAEPSAFYALPEGVRGIFLGSGGSVRIPRLIGTDRVMDMMLTGRTNTDQADRTQFRAQRFDHRHVLRIGDDHLRIAVAQQGQQFSGGETPIQGHHDHTGLRQPVGFNVLGAILGQDRDPVTLAHVARRHGVIELVDAGAEAGEAQLGAVDVDERRLVPELVGEPIA